MKKIVLILSLITGIFSYAQHTNKISKNQKNKTHTEQHHTPSQKLKKDGTPDKRYKENKKLKKDGTPDKRYKENHTK